MRSVRSVKWWLGNHTNDNNRLRLLELPSDPDDHDQRHLHLLTKSSLSTVANMSDGEVEVESPSGYAVLPKDVTDEIGSIKLFNKWSYEDVEIRDISLTYGNTIILSSIPIFLVVWRQLGIEKSDMTT
jgi:hypothetical protein